MSFIREKLIQICDKLPGIANTRLNTVSLEYVPCDGYKVGNTPPEDGWLPFPAGMQVRGNDSHYWFRCTLRTPPAKADTSYYVKFTTGYEGKWDATNPQGLVCANGEMVQGCDTNHTEVFLEPDTDYTLHNYFYTGMNTAWVPLEASLWMLDEKTERLFYDLNVALDCCMLQHPNSDEYIAIMGALEQTANLLDMRDFKSEAYRTSLDKALAFIDQKLYCELCTTENKPVVSCIGHTHIDVEWLWTRSQTREKIQRSFATAATLMKRYPNYLFMLSQPELYRYLKEEAPEKYEELKQLVKEGRWEPEGSMYVEADCNLISGESLVRQIFYGKKFFNDEFGVDCKILFLPDVFGYSAAMPQILKKSGIRHFVTSKISWNETNMMPVDCFLWEGIDGTALFTNFITTQKYEKLDNTNRYTTYVGMLTPEQIKGAWNRFQQKEYTTRTLCTYGYGDGGGGPTKKMLETQKRLAKGLPGMPVAKTDTLLNHLNHQMEEFMASCERTRRTPKWVGELYLEMHRGTYTSIAKIKRDNRKAEFLLQMAEGLSYIDMLNGGNYNQDGLNRCWTKVLHNQFHDIIPGSSIKEVYDGTDKDYAQICDYCDKLTTSRLSKIANSVKGNGNLVYNALGFSRGGIASFNGVSVEIQNDIPAFGWSVIGKVLDASDVQIDGLTAENRHYKLSLDQSGRISSLFDKKAGRSVLKDGCFGNELQAFEDFPRAYDNWEITDYYKQKMWVLSEDAIIAPLFDGSRGGFRVEKNYMHSRSCSTSGCIPKAAELTLKQKLTGMSIIKF